AVREQVRRSTVWIRAQVAEGESEGSGFVSRQGWVLTNAHVVENSRSVQVVFDSGTPQHRARPARVVRVGAPGTAQDIALLAVDTAGVPPLRLADLDKLPQGSPIAAFGFPLGASVAASGRGPEISLRGGRVSAFRRDGAGKLEWVESDMLIEVGSSGGPVVTPEARVVGLSTMVVGPLLRTARVVPSTNLRAFAPQAVQ
ncbi:MAG: trypsin-like peptidase domain-containing protein, partial [Fimbriimonadaceae bacterium]|nr:trypsin-like peptidase domain-containing protein [Fimbriimonadaceae bacterium]